MLIETFKVKNSETGPNNKTLDVNLAQIAFVGDFEADEKCCRVVMTCGVSLILCISRTALKRKMDNYK
jgi:hypothetical protein